MSDRTFCICIGTAGIGTASVGTASPGTASQVEA